MRAVKALAIALPLLLVAGVAAWYFWLRPQLTFADMASAYAAKMVCSCRFIGERPMDSCLTDFTADISALTVTEDGPRIRASALGGRIAAEAAFTPGLGCTLVTP